VQFSGSGQNARLVVNGSGFGAPPVSMPFTGDICCNAFYFYDITNVWTAGHGGDGVTINYASWSDTQIVVDGFAGCYGCNNWVDNPGDAIEIGMKNLATGQPAYWDGTVPPPASPTPNPTLLPTDSPTDTGTATTTGTATNAPTMTPTPPTPTPPTVTPTSTDTPTVTNTPQPTDTLTNTPTLSITSAPSITSTPAPSPTSAPTDTSAPSPTPTDTSTPAPTDTSAPTPPPTTTWPPLLPTLSLDPPTSHAAEVITATGSGFLPGEPLHLALSAPNGAASAADFAIDDSGAFVYPIRVPATGDAVSLDVVATGGTTGVSARATEALTPYSPTLALGASVARTGDVVTATGDGFRAGEPVHLTITGGAPVDVVADDAGRVSAALLVVQTQDARVDVAARGGFSGGTATMRLLIGSYGTAVVAAQPDHDAVGTTLTITGTGFRPDEYVVVAFGSSQWAEQAPRADVSGAFTATTTIPPVDPGGYTLAAVGQQSGQRPARPSRPPRAPRRHCPPPRRPPGPAT